MITGALLSGLITVVSSLAFLCFGYDNGVMSNLLAEPEFISTYNPSASQLGNIVSFLGLGAAIGALCSFLISENLGRRKTISLGAVLLMIGAILQASSFSSGQLIAGRLVGGLGLGLCTAAVPAWQAECTPKHNRGSLMTTDLLALSFGGFFAYWFEYGLLQHLSGPVTFRLPFAFQIIFQVAILALMPLVPESPRWLALHGHKDQALHVLALLQGSNVGEDNPLVQAQYDAIMNAAEIEGKGDANNFAMLFHNGQSQAVKRLILGIGVQFMSPWTGINVITYYFPFILATVLGKTAHQATLYGGFLQLTSLGSVIPVVIFIDKIGRKRMLLIGTCVQCACMAVLTGMFYMAINSTQAVSYGQAAIGIIFIYFS